jgi:hypothetical protein
MSSTPFSIRLVPERALRLAVLGSGLLATGIGAMVIAGLDLGGPERLAAAVVWLTINLRELWTLGRAYGSFGPILIHADGEVELSCRSGGRVCASLLGGSVILWQLAWLRFRVEDGRRHAELLRRNADSGEAWRRLQVLARHLGGAR